MNPSLLPTPSDPPMPFPRFMYPFLVYRSLFFPFVVLGSIVVPCWVLFRLYRRRNPRHRPPLRREVLLLVGVVYLSGLVSATLTPNDNARGRATATAGIDLRPSLASLTCSATYLRGGSSERSFCVRNAGGNVVLFFPLGVLVPLVWRRLRFRQALGVAIAVSLAIELVQLVSRAWGSYRSPDVNDILLNGLGAALGLALVFLSRLRQDTSAPSGATLLN